MTVFPIGHYMGERHPEGLHYVRLGLEHQTMTTDEFGVWVLSHQDSPQWSMADVVALAIQAELPNPSQSAERLLSAGLLTVVDDQQAFASSYRLDPLLVGLGNTPDAPDTYRIGVPGQEPAQLTASAYELWQWSTLAPTLWHTCEIRAKIAGTPTTDSLTEVLADIRPLLANSCAYLDKAR